MATKLDVYKNAVDFAFATLDVTSGRELAAQAAAKFGEAGFSDKEWDFWYSTATNQRNTMLNYKQSKAAVVPPAAPTPGV